jgi:hypothetical protein
VNELLGGAARKKTRARGFTPWEPRAKTLVLLEQVQAVLTEYEEYLPLTCRQIFYRLVGAHGYDKTEKAYGRLCEMLGRARRARRIDMDDIRDDGGQRINPTAWRDTDHCLDYMRGVARRFRLDRQVGQPQRLVIMCEAAGMVPQLADAVDDYGIMTMSSGGFESVTAKHSFAQTIATWDADTVEVLHVGDHDPSGVHLFLSLAEDVQAFAEDYSVEVRFTRLAVTPDQIESMSLPTAPPKKGDDRAFTGETCQAEAIPPDVLAGIVIDAVDERIERAVLEEVKGREPMWRAILLNRLEA